MNSRTQLSNRPFKSSGIEALESGSVLSTDPHFMALLVKAEFEAKFNALYDPGDFSWAPPDPSVLGVPTTVLRDDARALLMDPISSPELSAAITQLDVDKAEGLDGVTNSMIKNTGLVAVILSWPCSTTSWCLVLHPSPGRKAIETSLLQSFGN